MLADYALDDEDAYHLSVRDESGDPLVQLLVGKGLFHRHADGAAQHDQRSVKPASGAGGTMDRGHQGHGAEQVARLPRIDPLAEEIERLQPGTEASRVSA